tara:strand:- start:2791 stop:4398 length:1608 start_codon:yes stop_codon:yes gene_type:complete
MGLLDGVTHQNYYQGNDFGNYQFVSLHDIINQFMVVYVGDEKIIKKCNQTDVSFYAHRALAELSFDTFKSIKSYQIDLPPSLTMILPHDYVNYTKISSVDSAGIKHLLYPVKETNNPFQIKQNEESLEYSFPSGQETISNNSFSELSGQVPVNWNRIAAGQNHGQANFGSTVGIVDGQLTWSYVTKTTAAGAGWGQVGLLYQQVDVSTLTFADLSGDGVTSDITYNNASGNTNTGTAVGTIRLGLTTQDPSNYVTLNAHETYIHPGNNNITAGTVYPQSQFVDPNYFDLGYLEWTGNENSTKTLEGIDLSNHNTIYIIALSFIDATIPLTNGFALKPVSLVNTNPSASAGTITAGNINTLDNLSLINSYASTMLTETVGNEENSSTWKNYKSHDPSENSINDYQDYENNVYWPNEGERYGLDPKHAQINGSFYIDQRLGKIHFSSNISGKTVILDYISDSLGTDEEMKVHKFAEEAMYRYILHGLASAQMSTQQLVPRLKKEKFAAIRQAKLRLSNLKLEELTQILRGKSKQIKH